MLGGNCSPCCCKVVGLAMRNFAGPLRRFNYLAGRFVCANRLLHNLTTAWQYLGRGRVTSSHTCQAEVYLAKSLDGTQARLRLELKQLSRIIGPSGDMLVLEYAKPIGDYTTELLQRRIEFPAAAASAITVLNNDVSGATTSDAADVVLLVDPVVMDFANAAYEITISGDAVAPTYPNPGPPPPSPQNFFAGEIYTDDLYGLVHEFEFENPVDFVSDTQTISGLGDECATGFVSLEVPIGSSYESFPWLGPFFGLSFAVPAKRFVGNVCTTIGPAGMTQGQLFYIGEMNFVAFHDECVCQFEHLVFVDAGSQPAFVNTEFAVEMKVSPKADATDTQPVICGNPLP